MIWGNPCFDHHVIDMKIVEKMEFDAFNYATKQEDRPRKIKKQIEYARREGGGILYLHAFPKKEPGQDVRDHLWCRADIESARKEFGDKIVVSQVPGIEEVYFVYVKTVKP